MTAQTEQAIGHDADVPHIRRIGFSDLALALRKGSTDFWRHPSHYIFLVIIYPVAGVLIAFWTAGTNMFPLLYPLAAGFALIGPFAALGLYELSRRREQGLSDSPDKAFAVLRSPARMSILALGLMLALVFSFWLVTAQALYDAAFPTTQPDNLWALLSAVFTTQPGWNLLFWGNLIGLPFALFVLATTAIAFPLLLDRGGTPVHAMEVSARVFFTNPLPMLAWGLIVSALLLIGSLPLFVGLALVLPILGHATWHLYRATVA